MFLELHLSDDNEKIMLNTNCINSIYQTKGITYIYIGKVVYRVKESYEQIEEAIKVDGCVKNIDDYDIPIHNDITIPENTTKTNRDIIKAMFNPYRIYENSYRVHVYMTKEDYLKSNYQINCSAKWWNAPYKAESKEI